MGHAVSDAKFVLWLSLLHGFLFLIAGTETEDPADNSTIDISSRRFRAEFLQEYQGSSESPYFDPTTPRNVTGLVGHPVRLLCRVKNLKNRTVSWVRHRDIHLLTVGRYTYTSDQRFEAQHKQKSEEWTLRIRSPQRRDSGQYECQISTTPPVGQAVFLNIVEPETTISSGAELFIQAESTINLTCTVQHTPEPPTSITWTHGDQVINFDSARGGISLVTEKGLKSTSRLLVQRARGDDAGIYTCGPNNAPPASTRVHVLSGMSPRGAAAETHGCCSVSVELPSTTVELPSTTVEMPLTTGELPSTTVEMPSTTVEPPSTTVEPPSTTVKLPSTTVKLPSTTVELPSTEGTSPHTETGTHVGNATRGGGGGEGEHPAAMQQGCARSSLDLTASIICSLFIIYLLGSPYYDLRLT